MPLLYCIFVFKMSGILLFALIIIKFTFAEDIVEAIGYARLAGPLDWVFLLVPIIVTIVN